MPREAEILSVQVDQKNATTYIWALVDTEKVMYERYFEVIGTGHPIYEDMGVERKFIGTIQLNQGSFIGHVFERL